MKLSTLLTLILIGTGIVLVNSAKVKKTQKDALFDEYGSFGTKLVFYAEEFLGGLSTKVETDGPCKNLPVKWEQKPLSVDTLGTCGVICTEPECEGTCLRVYPAHGEQQLSTVGMAKKVSSVKTCFK